MTGPGHRRALFAAVTAGMVVAVLALGSMPSPTRVERAAAVAGARNTPERRAPATTTTTATPTATVVPGLHAVGPAGVRPGVYVASSDLCSWERRGGDGKVVAGDTGSGQVLVEVRPADVAFSSSPGCGTWRAFPPLRRRPHHRHGGGGPAALASFGPGTFAVGTQVAPGRWRSDSGGLCYWERLAGLGGGLDELVASAGVPGPTEVVVGPTDAAFSSFGCGTWRPVG